MKKNSKKIIMLFMFVILLLLMSSNVRAVGSTGSTGGSSQKVYAQSIKITNNSSKGIKLGESYQFKATITPNNVTDKTITWSSSDPSILSIDKNGKAVAKKKGTVKVTAKTSNGKTDSISVTVKKANTTTGELEKVKSVSITNNPKEMLVGDTFTLKTSISPHYVDDDTLAFKSSNTKVLKVDENGKVTAVGKGTAKITATSNNGKKAEIKITVSNVKITLSSKSVSINKGDTYEIIATIKSNKSYNDSAKWTSSSATNSTVKSSGHEYNTYKAIITGKSTGISSIKFKIADEEESAQVKIVEAGKDKSLACPIITYDTSSNSKITINIQPASTTDHYDFATSTNKKSGWAANWNTKNQNLRGNQTLYANYTEAQGKIRIYGKEGTSRDCYTAPFDLDGKKNSGTDIYNFFYKSPSIKLNSKTQYITGLERYKLNFNNNYSITLGVRKAYLDISSVPNEDYQYSWYTNKNEYTNSISEGKWQLYKTFNDSQTVTLTTSSENNYDRQGIVLAIDDQGNVQITFTEIYSPKSFNYFDKKGTTYIFRYIGESCPGSDNTISYINTLYKNAPYLFRNKYLSISGTDAITFGSWADSFVNVPCNDSNTYIGVIHEMAHAFDRTAYLKYGHRISDDDEMRKLKAKYNSNNNLAQGTNLNCPYNWFYDQKNEFEFFVGLYTHYYLDKFYKGKSSSEIDRLHIHDCWKWMLKNRNIDSDVKSFIEKSIRDYK